MYRCTQTSPVLLAFALLPIGLAGVVGCKNEGAETHSRGDSDLEGAVGGASRATDRVTLAFDAVDLDDVRPFLIEESGKWVTIRPGLERYKLTLISPEVMSRSQACERVFDKLRSDGLEIVETEDTIVFGPGEWEWTPPLDWGQRPLNGQR